MFCGKIINQGNQWSGTTGSLIVNPISASLVLDTTANWSLKPGSFRGAISAMAFIGENFGVGLSRSVYDIRVVTRLVLLYIT